MKFKIDLHVHSKFSGDNTAEPEELIQKAIELNLHGIAFTEHYSYEASEHVEKLREKYSGSITILRGVEFSAVEGHCLIFGVNTDRMFLRDIPAGELVQAVNSSNGVLIPSHPFRGISSMGDKVKKIAGLCALEGYNGCNMQPFNIKAVATAKALNLAYTGGSDAHAADEVGSCYTEFSERVTYENLVALLRKGNYMGVDIRKISRMSW